MADEIDASTAPRLRFGRLLFILMAVVSFGFAGCLMLFPASLGLDQTNASFIALALIASGVVDAIIAYVWDRITAR